MQSFNSNDPGARVSGPIGQKASDTIDEARDSVDRAANKTADAVGTAANYVRDNDAKGMLADVQRLVKNNPGPALLTAAALGFVLARIFARE